MHRPVSHQVFSIPPFSVFSAVDRLPHRSDTLIRSVVWGKIIFLLFFFLPAFIVWINVFAVYGEIIAQFINVSKLYYICCALSIAEE